jgi:hypothetical protein
MRIILSRLLQKRIFFPSYNFHLLKPDITRLEPSDSSSETDSSPSLGEDSDSEPEDAHASRNDNLQDLDDDEDPVPNGTSGSYFQTKHEIAETDIVIPEVDRIDPDEVLEKVGEVMNIVGRVVIIKGLPSNMLHRGSDRALDSETLLVFDDRTVMGYVRPFFFSLSLVLLRNELISHNPRVGVRNIWPDGATFVPGQIQHCVSTGLGEGENRTGSVPRTREEPVCICQSDKGL